MAAEEERLPRLVRSSTPARGWLNVMDRRDHEIGVCDIHRPCAAIASGQPFALTGAVGAAYCRRV